jgi:hypothetical protein
MVPPAWQMVPSNTLELLLAVEDLLAPAKTSRVLYLRGWETHVSKVAKDLLLKKYRWIVSAKFGSNRAGRTSIVRPVPHMIGRRQNICGFEKQKKANYQSVAESALAQVEQGHM